MKHRRTAVGSRRQQDVTISQLFSLTRRLANPLVNLGGTAIGIDIFTAATQAAAWTALGVAPAGTVNGGTF